MAGWRYTLALTWVKEKETPVAVLERLWAQVKLSRIACKMVLLDRYFFTVPVLNWLKQRDLPFIIPVVMRGRKPKRGQKAKGLRACRSWQAGTHPYTHTDARSSVDFNLVISYKTYHHRRTKKRHVKKLYFATWKVRRPPVEVREMYRKRFGIEASYRQLNQSRSRTSSRDPLYRLLLVGLSLFLRNVWQWLVQKTLHAIRRQKRTAPPHGRSTLQTPRYHDILDAFSEFLHAITQRLHSTTLTS